MTLEPGDECSCAAFADTLLLVARGTVVLEGFGGTRADFPAGSLLAFDPGVLRVLRNEGAEPALLVRCTPWTT